MLYAALAVPPPNRTPDHAQFGDRFYIKLHQTILSCRMVQRTPTICDAKYLSKSYNKFIKNDLDVFSVTNVVTKWWRKKHRNKKKCFVAKNAHLNAVKKGTGSDICLQQNIKNRNWWQIVQSFYIKIHHRIYAQRVRKLINRGMGYGRIWRNVVRLYHHHQQRQRKTIWVKLRRWLRWLLNW